MRYQELRDENTIARVEEELRQKKQRLAEAYQARNEHQSAARRGSLSALIGLPLRVKVEEQISGLQEKVTATQEELKR